MGETLQDRLRHGVGDVVRDHHLMAEAADIIDALEAERDSYRKTANEMAERAARAEAERDRLRLSDNDIYYLRAINRRLDEFAGEFSDLDSMGLGGEAFADEREWLADFIDRSTLKGGNQMTYTDCTTIEKARMNRETPEELQARMRAAQHLVPALSVIRHVRTGNLYVVLDHSLRVGDLELLVTYAPHDDTSIVFSRPVSQIRAKFVLASGEHWPEATE